MTKVSWLATRTIPKGFLTNPVVELDVYMNNSLSSVETLQKGNNNKAHSTAVLFSLAQWEGHTNKHGWLLDIIVLIAQNTHGTGLKHQGKWKLHRVLEPALHESSEYMSVCNEHYITGCFAMHIWCMEGVDLGD
jgi:hypothetical protein